MNKNNVLILTGDPIGKKMSGPGIRAYNFAIELSETSNVILASSNYCDLREPNFSIVQVKNHLEFEELEKWADVIVLQGNAVIDYPSLRKSSKYIVCDLYVPMQLEQLEQGKDNNLNIWNQRIAHANHILSEQLYLGDFFLAASERQRDFWLGSLTLAGRINAKNYNFDKTLRHLISVVPFGLPNKPPFKEKQVLKGVVKGINKDDKVIIWAGGIYNWFDPLTLVKAMGILKKTHPKLKLFFMGTQHPHPGVPEMEILNSSFKLSSELGLLGENVFFNSEWVPYEERQNYLLSSDIGVSTHFEHIETRFSFRTRILDYLWAQLPIITTDGDYFADLVKLEVLGAVVPEKDEVSLARAIVDLVENQSLRNQAIKNIDRISQEKSWKVATLPLAKYCTSPYYAPDKIYISKSGITQKVKSPPRKGPFLLVRKKIYVAATRYKSEGLWGVWALFSSKLRFDFFTRK